MLRFIDNVVARLFHTVLSVYLRLLGKDKFYHARSEVGSARILLCLGMFLLTDGVRFRYLVVVAGWCVIIAMCRSFLWEITKIEKNEADSSGMLVFSYFYKYSIRLGLAVSVLLTLVIAISGNGWTGALIGWPSHWDSFFCSLGALSLCSSIYFATDAQPPRKNIFRRALDWLKAHKPEISWGGIRPHPMPS